MVRRGEYLERPVVIAGPSGALEGLYHRGKARPPLLVAASHPDDGGSMETTIIAEMAWAVTRAGHASLRFNYRGVGASEGKLARDDEADADAQAAIDHLRACVAPDALETVTVAFAGVGFGGEVALRAAGDRPEVVTQVIVVSPRRLLAAELERYRGDVLIIFGEHDHTADRSGFQQLAERGPNTRVTVIPQADRAFLRGLGELGRIIAETLSPPGMIDLSVS